MSQISNPISYVVDTVNEVVETEFRRLYSSMEFAVQHSRSISFPSVRSVTVFPCFRRRARCTSVTGAKGGGERKAASVRLCYHIIPMPYSHVAMRCILLDKIRRTIEVPTGWTAAGAVAAVDDKRSVIPLDQVRTSCHRSTNMMEYCCSCCSVRTTATMYSHVYYVL